MSNTTETSPSAPASRSMGLGVKVVALIVVPLVLMAALNLAVGSKITGLFEKTLVEIEKGDKIAAEITKDGNAISHDMSKLLLTFSTVTDTHQSSLLAKRPTPATRKARDEVAKEIKHFDEDMVKLKNVLEESDLLSKDA